jgi:hypothetical protein
MPAAIEVDDVVDRESNVVAPIHDLGLEAERRVISYRNAVPDPAELLLIEFDRPPFRKEPAVVDAETRILDRRIEHRPR